jgi:hypothetical protein
MSIYRKTGYVLGFIIQLMGTFWSIIKNLSSIFLNLLLLVWERVIHCFKMKKLKKEIAGIKKTSTNSSEDKV